MCALGNMPARWTFMGCLLFILKRKKREVLIYGALLTKYFSVWTPIEFLITGVFLIIVEMLEKP